jgi:hypothetical protein
MRFPVRGLGRPVPSPVDVAIAGEPSFVTTVLPRQAVSHRVV